MPTTYEFDLLSLVWLVVGLILGLALDSLTWGRAARRHRRATESVSNASAASAARTQAEQSQRELAAAQAAMRPLADEVDRLKRELAKARRPVQPPLPLGSDAAAVREEALYVPDAAALAGAGPIVVDAAPAGHAVPDIRRLKGVGDRFAVALAGLGLGSVDALARLNADEAADADTRLGQFNGRIARDRLVEQAVLLDEGRTTEYEARFGKLG